MGMPQGFFHLANGFFFRRDENGTIQIMCDPEAAGLKKSGDGSFKIVHCTVDDSSFASAVASCSIRGDNAETHKEAMDLLQKPS